MKDQRKIIFVITLLVIVLVSCYLIYEWVIFKSIGYLSKLENYDDLKIEIKEDVIYANTLEELLNDKLILESDNQMLIKDIINTINEFKVRRTKNTYREGRYIIKIYNDEVSLTFSIINNNIEIRDKKYKVKVEDVSSPVVNKILSIVENYK